MIQGTALPPWLQQILPKWFCDRPAFTEALYAFIVSFVYASVPIIFALYGAAVSAGVPANDFLAFLSWLGHNWWALLMGYIGGGGIAGIRARQANAKANAQQDVPQTPNATGKE